MMETIVAVMQLDKEVTGAHVRVVISRKMIEVTPLLYAMMKETPSKARKNRMIR